MRKLSIVLLVFQLILSKLAMVNGQQVFPSGGSGSYRLDYPGWNFTHDIYAPIGDYTTSHIKKGPGYSGPLQTHTWWSSALWDRGNITVNEGAKTLTDNGFNRHSGVMYPYPMSIESEAKGFIVRHGFSDINGLGTEIEVHSAVIDYRVGLFGVADASDTRVDGYGDWHAVFYQDHGSGNILRMTAAQGCPFMFFQRTGNAQPYIYGLNKVVVRKSTSGNSFIINVAPEGRPVYLGVFFPAGTRIGDDGAPYNLITGLGIGGFGGGWDNMVFDMPVGSNYFSVAVMSNTSQATLDLYESKAFNFITQTSHAYSFSETNSTLTTNFDVTTTNVYGGANTGTLQCLYKHQWKYSPQASGALNTGLTYISPRGDMKVLATNSFSTVMKHYGLLPNLGFAHKYNPVQMRSYIDNFLNTQAINQEPADGYAKDGFVDFANIAQIADQIGYTAARNKALDAMQSRLVDWFTANDNWAMFVYDANFNYLAHYPNGFTSSGHFIDMHFHMAYLIYGAAILARYRPAFATQYGAMVETMIRQINDYRKDNSNPGNIGWFPYLRFFDPYAGHSWAGPDAGDQESVSESMLFNYGVFLWGDITNNTNLRDLGALLYITEAEAGKMYWYDTDHSINYNWQGGTYPQNHMTIVRHRGGSYATFFSADNRWKHSITILPATAGTLWMSWDGSQSQTMFNDLPAGGYPAWDDHGYFYDFLHTSFDPASAKSAFNTYAVSEQWINPTFPHVNGDIPILYQWVNTFDSVGVYDNTVQADITQFSVFTKGICKHYMVFNPKGRGTRTVHFSDGQTFNVPDDTLITYKVCNVPLGSQVVYFKAKETKNGAVELNWSIQESENVMNVTVEVSVNGSDWVKLEGDEKEEMGIEKTQRALPSVNSMVDYKPKMGINYYRLKIKGMDGSFKNSGIESVSIGDEMSGIEVFPNPATSLVSVKLKALDEEKVTIRLLDVTGKIMNPSFMNGGMDISGLNSGVYILEVSDGTTEKMYRERIVKY